MLIYERWGMGWRAGGRRRHPRANNAQLLIIIIINNAHLRALGYGVAGGRAETTPASPSIASRVEPAASRDPGEAPWAAAGSRVS